jgi:hypothetical protein
MDAEPSEQTARRSTLEPVSFGLIAVGALLMGIGSLLTWVTVGIADQLGLQTVSPGTDLSAGLLTLVCAVVILVLLIVGRAVAASASRAITIVMVALGATAAVVAAYFIVAAPSHYSPVDDDQLVGAIAAATGRGTDEVRTALAQVIDQLGGFTHVGPGAWVVILGGVAVVAGGLVSLRAASRRRPREDAGEPIPSMEPAAD